MTASAKPQMIGFWMTAALVVGTIIGSGIFMLPISLAPLGRNALIGWVISGVGILCIAYGSDKELFVDTVEKDFLPKQRAQGCATEYEDLAFAMTRLIGPHIDKRLASKFHETWARTVDIRRARLTRR